MLAAGADPNARTSDGMPPIKFALNTRSPALVDTLVKRGALLDDYDRSTMQRLSQGQP